MSIFRAGFFSLFALSVSLLISDETELSNNKTKESSFPVGGDVTLALDSFRSLPDGSWGGNMGAFGSLNLGFALPKVQEGIGAQLGISFGIYDWDGRGSTDSKSLQLEGFVSAGLFRMTPKSSGFNGGIVYDWLFNRESGVFGLSPSLSQIRGQIGYLLWEKNELGIWASYDTQTAHLHYQRLPVVFRAISQANAFWRHIFKNKGEIMIWGGTPYRQGLMFESGRAGSYIIGAGFKAPLSTSLSLEGHGVYMGARSNTGDMESQNYAANICFGLTYSFGGRKTGARPYLPLANNSNFLVDTSLSY